MPSACAVPLLSEQLEDERTSAIRVAPASLDRSRRIEFLDVLRGVAAFMVLCQHSVECVSPSFMRWTVNFVNFGEVGVVVFFLISGFIIPFSLEKYNSLPRFWTGRLLRLWPAYLTSLALVMTLNRFGLLKINQLPEYGHRHLALFVLGNISMFAEYLRIPNAIGAYWTLSLELVFYMVCSLLFLFGLLGRTRLWVWVSTAILLLSQLAIGVKFHQSLPAGRIGLLVTALYGTLLYRQRAERTSPRMIFTILPVLFSVFAIAFWLRSHFYTSYEVMGHHKSPNTTVLCTVTSWVSAYLIFLVAYELRSKQFPRLLMWVGQISYPLYLFHGLVLGVMPTTLVWPVFLLLALAISLLLAQLVHVLIEKPIGRFQATILPHKAVPA